jgi:hypothetical protein
MLRTNSQAIIIILLKANIQFKGKIKQNLRFDGVNG